MKILIYGLGQGLELVEDRLEKTHEIIGYTDSYSALSVFRGKPFYRLEEINRIFFDYLIITVKERKTAWEIYNALIKRFNLAEEQIIPFYVYANYESHVFKMKGAPLENIEGLIFGNSHAQCGFLESWLETRTLNLAVSAQDIYYNYQIFQYCISVWGHRLKILKYIIIDLYDYCYFNFDTSMLTNAVDYILGGGYLDQHNFNNNKNYKRSFEEELFDRYYIPYKSSSLIPLFCDVSGRSTERFQDSRYQHIDKTTTLGQGPILGSVIAKRNEHTIKENIELFELFLKNIRDFRKDIHIIFTLIPRYIAMEQATAPFIALWKKEFYEEIDRLSDKYGALFWNYKQNKEISGNHMFYFDSEHLNTVGGRALTSILNRDLKKLLNK